MNDLNKKPFFPEYSYLPFFALLVLHLLTYYGTLELNRYLPHHNVQCFLDRLIPLIPQWIYFYVLAFPFWLICAATAMREDRDTCYEIFSGILVGELICFAAYLLYPSTIVQPAVPDDGSLAAKLMDIIYSADEARNVFPSTHCMISWMFYLYAKDCKNAGKLWEPFCLVMAVGISLSTQFVKQHAIVDLAAGIGLAELCVHASRKLELGRMFAVGNKLIKEKLHIR